MNADQQTPQETGSLSSLFSPFTEVVSDQPEFSVHETAIVEDGAEIGIGSSVWDGAHVRAGAEIGRGCVIGEKAYLSHGVTVGDRVQIQAGVYIPSGVTIGDGVLISAGVVFSNEKFPRATTPDLGEVREPEEPLQTRVRSGATIGAGSMIVGGIEIGSFAMVGMGSVVTKSVSAFNLVMGNPAHPIGAICRCGRPTSQFADAHTALAGEVVQCPACGMRYQIRGVEVTEFNPPESGRNSSAFLPQDFGEMGIEDES